MKKGLWKVVALLLVWVMLAGLVGCGGGKEQASQDNTQQQSQDSGKKKIKAGVLFPVPDPANGGGFERMMMTGVNALKNDFGWDVSVAENVAYPKVSEIASAYADKGYDIIFFPDNGMIEAWKELPKKYPNTWFIMMSLADELPEGGKAAAMNPNKFAYGTIVGATAAKLSKTGVIGLVGGMPVAAIMAEFSGIIEGAKAVRPDAKVVVGWAGDFVDVGKHSETTSLLIQQGADILFTVSGPGYKGVWEAAEKAGKQVIGYAYDSYDLAPNVIITSGIYDGVKQYSEIAKMLEAGTLENKLYPVGYDYMKIADFNGKISPELEKDIRDTVEKIQKGEINIPVKLYDKL